ncbi:hypothetical protein HDE_05028 [Halotydeus destructor]|nr:hypothetical protein HDE_05028 [Halotydeus destructor]
MVNWAKSAMSYERLVVTISLVLFIVLSLSSLTMIGTAELCSEAVSQSGKVQLIMDGIAMMCLYLFSLFTILSRKAFLVAVMGIAHGLHLFLSLFQDGHFTRRPTDVTIVVLFGGLSYLDYYEE